MQVPENREALKVKCSIAVIGAGVAGVSAAKQVTANCNADVVIVDKNNVTFPSKSSAFTFTETVKKYQLEKAARKYYSKVGLYSFLGSKVTYELDSPQLAVLDYSIACKEIFSSVRNGQIQLLSRTRAKKVKKDRNRICLELEGASDSTLECSLLIDASGSSFLTADLFRFRIPRFFSHAYGYELEHCRIPDSNLDELSFFMGRSIGSGGGWFYPLSNDKCRFGVAMTSTLPSFPRETLDRLYDFAKHHMHPFSTMLQDSQPLEAEVGSVPAEPVKKLAADNVMRVGDAAGHATPHMMEGIRPCIESGMLCGGVAAEAYNKGNFSQDFLKKYENLWHNQHKLQYLYLLSEADVNFSHDDRKVEGSIRSQARRSTERARVNSGAYLNGLGGNVRFPFVLVGRPSPKRLITLTRFVYRNLSWFLE
jgi:flavin-dependent dehydrogenase